MKIAIVGGTGFLGVAVVRHALRRGLEVVVLARGREPMSLPGMARFIALDRRDCSTLSAFFREDSVDVVVDIFALSMRNTRPVLDAVGSIGSRYLLVSSTDVYSNYAGLLKKEQPAVRPDPAMEDSPLRTSRYPYRGNSRRPQGVSDDLFEDYDKIPIEDAVRADRRFESVVVRLPMIFGPQDKQHRFAWAIKNARAGEPFAIDERAAGWLNSYGYIDDMADALVLAATHPDAAGQTYNVAQPKDKTVREWAETILGVMGVETEIVIVPAEERGIMADRADAMDLRYPLTLDSTKIRRELGYTETITEREALERTIAWELSQI